MFKLFFKVELFCCSVRSPAIVEVICRYINAFSLIRIYTYTTTIYNLVRAAGAHSEHNGYDRVCLRTTYNLCNAYINIIFSWDFEVDFFPNFFRIFSLVRLCGVSIICSERILFVWCFFCSHFVSLQFFSPFTIFFIFSWEWCWCPYFALSISLSPSLSLPHSFFCISLHFFLDYSSSSELW